MELANLQGDVTLGSEGSNERRSDSVEIGSIKLDIAVDVGAAFENERDRRDTVVIVQTRFEFIDITRGVIMVLMSLDHLTSWITCRHTSATEFRWKRSHALDVAGVDEFYNNSFFVWFTRHITHICAPGFVFLMGLSMAIVFKSRLIRRNWKIERVVKYFMMRR